MRYLLPLLAVLFLCAFAPAQIHAMNADGTSCLNKGTLKVKEQTTNRCWANIFTDCIGDDLSIHVLVISSTRGQINAWVGGAAGTRLFFDADKGEFITVHLTVKCKGKPTKRHTFEFKTQ